MKILIKILILLSLFATPIAYASLVDDHCSGGHLVINEECSLCDTMSKELAD